MNNKNSNEFIKTNIIKEHSKPNFVSRFFMWWVYPVVIKGNKRNIEEEDLIKPDITFSSEVLGDRLERYWLRECEYAKRGNRQPSLCKAMCRAFWLSYMSGTFNIIVYAGASIVQPMLFAKLLAFWAVDSKMTRLEAGQFAVAMLGLSFVRMMSQHHHTFFASCFALKMKVACSALLFRKLLRMSHISIGEVAAGKLVNILSNDMVRYDYVFLYSHNLCVVPIQLSIILYFLYISAGQAPFIGLFSVILLFLPIQVGLTKLSALIRLKVAERSDTRIKLMTEIINSIQVIKMYAWEKPFQSMVESARAHEMRALWKSLCIRFTIVGFMLYSERTMLFITILTTLALTGNFMPATLIYPIQQYYSIIQLNVTIVFPVALANISEMLVSLQRIQLLLMMEEKEDFDDQLFTQGITNKIMFNSTEQLDDISSVIATKYTKMNVDSQLVTVETKSIDNVKDPECIIKLDNVSASWSKSKKNEDMTIKKMSLNLEKGKLYAIIGSVGAGKSAFLHLILKELPLSEGNMVVNGTISYASQESWMFPATVRENILFGLPYDDQKYKEVCRVCSLLPDFKQFPYGDHSLIGERGVTLSGGQKARVNLARCIYRQVEIYLLDDPLSAVDANVGWELFEECIKGYLSGRTRILVTHQVHYLELADAIIILDGGAVKKIGKFNELVKTEKNLSSLLFKQESEVTRNEIKKKAPSIRRNISKVSNSSLDNLKDENIEIQEAEGRATGGLKWKEVLTYLKSVKSISVVIFTSSTMVITQIAATTVDYWLSYWINQVNHYRQSLTDTENFSVSLDETIGSLSIRQYILVYGCLVLSVICITQLRIVYFIIMTMRASQNLHNAAYKIFSIATMRFFDTNPSGRVLNRFSKDIGAIDELLPRSILDSTQMFFSIISILVLNAIVLPWTLIPTFILIIILTYLFKYYLNAAQAVKRLESTTKSPIFGMITSTISGISTIRSTNSENVLLSMFDNVQNLNSIACYTFAGGSSAFALHLDVHCLIYLGAIITIFLLGDFSDLIPLGSVGLAVSQTMMLTLLLQLTIRYAADFFGHMTSLERILEYTKLPVEKNMNDKTTEFNGEWPSNGTITFDNVSLNYGPDNPPVLKNLNFEIKSGWKVGVVGRTGAGKSSLISALFQLYEVQGNIKIDGIDVRTITKQTLRSKISIIPQEPVLFSATVRYNLDPCNQYNDEKLWNALEQRITMVVETHLSILRGIKKNKGLNEKGRALVSNWMKTTIHLREMFGIVISLIIMTRSVDEVELKEIISTLDYKVTAGGTNFSMGQRQLLCLARAILRSNTILIMDEATANVDPQTDGLIQKTIRREFANCTVITIAHRINTIMDSDRILVIDKGVVAEFDLPQSLLSNPNSIFSFMVKETGYTTSRLVNEQ